MMVFVVQAADLPVLVKAKFFAALDPKDEITWTDDPWRAQRFDTMVDAEGFARDRTDHDDWVIKPAPVGEPVTSWASMP